MKSQYDVVILGAGHNGLVAAAYLARAGLSVLLLEKNDYIGGATTSQKLFADYDARLSRYSYLVSLFPEKIIRDLGLNLELRRRATASFTPYVMDGQHNGLLLSNVSEETSQQSMFELTGNRTEYEQMRKFYNLSRVFAEHVWDTMLEPLVAKEDFRRRFDIDDISREAWRSLAEEPLGRAIERYLQNDLVRGLVFTDAKVGVLTYPHDPSLVQNRCFLYQLIGNKTDEGSVFKINMLLRRLPKLKAKKCTAAEAFCGTFHSDEGYEQMNLSYNQAGQGRLPNKTPCEVYCHTLTDDSILAPELREKGFHTMTLFGLDTPWRLFARDNKTMRKLAEKKFLESMNQWLEEPLEDCLAVAGNGDLCIESKSPVDIEDALGMYHGNIFQDAPTFPFAEKKAQIGKWGVGTEFENVFLCGSSALRGGAVSGIPVRNAAKKVLSEVGQS